MAGSAARSQRPELLGIRPIRRSVLDGQGAALASVEESLDLVSAGQTRAGGVPDEGASEARLDDVGVHREVEDPERLDLPGIEADDSHAVEPTEVTDAEFVPLRSKQDGDVPAAGFVDDRDATELVPVLEMTRRAPSQGNGRQRHERYRCGSDHGLGHR